MSISTSSRTAHENNHYFKAEYMTPQLRKKLMN